MARFLWLVLLSLGFVATSGQRGIFSKLQVAKRNVHTHHSRNYVRVQAPRSEGLAATVQRKVSPLISNDVINPSSLTGLESLFTQGKLRKTVIPKPQTDNPVGSYSNEKLLISNNIPTEFRLPSPFTFENYGAKVTNDVNTIKSKVPSLLPIGDSAKSNDINGVRLIVEKLQNPPTTNNKKQTGSLTGNGLPSDGGQDDGSGSGFGDQPAFNLGLDRGQDDGSGSGFGDQPAFNLGLDRGQDDGSGSGFGDQPAFNLGLDRAQDDGAGSDFD